jgi:hypothetical protein
MEKFITIYDLNQYVIELNRNKADPGIPSCNRKNPGQMAIQNILNYSRALMVLKTNTTGIISLLLN